MAYIGNFDASQIEPADFSALPAGDYTVLISNSEFKNSKAGESYLALTLQVVDGPYSGRYLWHNLNLQHSNPKAVEIAQRELSAICRAVGKMVVQDSAELHDIPLIIKVAYIPPRDNPAGGQWPEKNQIKQWKSTQSPNGNTATAVARPAPAAKPPVPTPPAAPAAAKAPIPPAQAQTRAQRAPAPPAPAAQAPATPPWKRAPAYLADPSTKAEAVADDDVVW